MRLGFRKSVATLIDQTVDSEAAQAQLGQASEDITLEHYIHKAKVAPDVTDYLERFRPPMTPKTWSAPRRLRHLRLPSLQSR